MSESERHYPLVTDGSDVGYARYYTGLLPTGEQILMGACENFLVLLRFSADGRFVDYVAKPLPSKSSFNPDVVSCTNIITQAVLEWKTELRISPSKILIRRFGIFQPTVCIADYPEHLNYLEPESESDEDPTERAIKAWKRQGKYVLFWGESDYYMNRDGIVESI